MSVSLYHGGGVYERVVGRMTYVYSLMTLLHYVYMVNMSSATDTSFHYCVKKSRIVAGVVACDAV